jgi:hypothetical protein
VAVTFVAKVTQWGVQGGSSTATSGSFTPTASNQLVVFNSCIQTGTQSASGTGTYNQVGSQFSSSVNVSCFANLNLSGGSQTVAVSTTASLPNLDGFAYQYSGAATASNFSGVSRAAPGTGSGAITGTSVNVPSGAVLLALCGDTTNGTTITSPSGTNRDGGTVGTVGATISGWTVTEYSGTGANITPTFTDATRGATDTYIVVQMVLAPAAGGPFVTDIIFTQPQLKGRNNFLNSDTSHGMPKTLFADATKPTFNPPHFSPVPHWPHNYQNPDTSQNMPKVLFADATTPFFNPPHFPPQRHQWYPPLLTERGTFPQFIPAAVTSFKVFIINE